MILKATEDPPAYLVFLVSQPAGEGGPEYNVVPDTSRRRRQVDDEESETNVEEPVNVRAEGPRTGESREGKRTVLLVGFN